MFCNLACLFGRTLVLAIVHAPVVKNFVSYEFKESYHNNTEPRMIRMAKDFGIELDEPFKKYGDK